jgi:DNA ligase-1
VSFQRLRFIDGAVHLPDLGLWLDRHEPCPAPERVFVSHAHSDHIAAHHEVILSEPTAKLMRARLPGERLEHTLQFGETRNFTYGTRVFEITLIPAGHIFGSAMALVNSSEQSLLYTGDFKLRRGLSAEPCEPRHADILVMETTFGRPEYRFPPTDAVIASVIRFCREALDNDETPVLLGYSLGKSQELLCGLGDAGLPLMLHGTVWNLTKVYEQFGQCFPPYERYEAGTARGKVLLCPPSVSNSAMLRKLGRVRTAVLTGWAVDPNCRYRYQCGAAFVLSDHADYPGLVEFVRLVEPKKVYTLHGFAADFARSLREMGWDAEALSEEEQFTLGLDEGGPRRDARLPSEKQARSELPLHEPNAASKETKAGHPFAAFAAACAAICVESRKLEKVRILADYLRTLGGRSVGLAATWFSGRPFPSTQNKVLQLGWAVIREAVCQAAGVDHPEFHDVYLK